MSCGVSWEVDCLSSRPHTITSLGQRLCPLGPQCPDRTLPLNPKITAQAYTLFPQSIVTLDGGKLIHLQKWDGQETTLVRELIDGKLILVRWATLEPYLIDYYYCSFSQACSKKPSPPLRAIEAGTREWLQGQGGVRWEFSV